jgi:hypothetical protein
VKNGIGVILLFSVMGIVGIACNGSQSPSSGNNSSTPTPTGPVTAQVFKNGSLSSWLGPYLESGSLTSPGNGGGFTSRTDSITGDTTSLYVSGNTSPCVGAGTCGDYYVNAETQASGGSAVADDASAYLANGHMQFDIELGNTASSYSTVIVYGESGPIGSQAYSSYNLTPSNYSTTFFTHVSIPISSIYTNGASSTLVYQCFSMGLVGVSVPVSVFVDDVEWTTN